MLLFDSFDREGRCKLPFPSYSMQRGEDSFRRKRQKESGFEKTEKSVKKREEKVNKIEKRY
jgi:hypothetical protein